MKEKAKEFWEEQKGEIARVVYFGLGLGIGYFTGKSIMGLRIENGLQRCIKAKPELDGMIKEAVNIISDKKK